MSMTSWRTFVWRLREGEGESLEDIASAERLPPPQVRQRVSRLRRLFRASLERLGVRRVVLAAGRYDATRRALEATARRLVAEGFAARFVDLGAVGHTYVPSRAVPGWGEALGWLEDAGT